MTFTNFCNMYNKKLLTNPDAEKVFLYLATGESIAGFITFTKRNLPAISGIASELESQFDNSTSFPMENRYNRQLVGKMVKYILYFFGYETEVGGVEQRDTLRQFSKSEYFKTAAVYHKTGVLPQKKLMITIV